MNFRLPHLLHPKPSIRLLGTLGWGALTISSKLKSSNFLGVFLCFFFCFNFQTVNKHKLAAGEFESLVLFSEIPKLGIK
jgi:hypothetical protein